MPPSGRTLGSLYTQLLGNPAPPRPVSTDPNSLDPYTIPYPQPEFLADERPRPMTLAEMAKAAVFGGVLGMPRPYRHDPQYERSAAVGQMLDLGLPLMTAGAGAAVKAARAPKSAWSSTIKNAILERGGYSVQPKTGVVVEPGTKDAVMVGRFPNSSGRTMSIPADRFSEKDVDAFKRTNRDIFEKDPTAHIGGWLEKDQNGRPLQVYLDVAQRHDTVRAATKFGEQQNPGALAKPWSAKQKAEGIPRQWTPTGLVRDPETGAWPQAQKAVWHAESGAEPPVGNFSEFVNSPEFQARLHEMAAKGKEAMGPEFHNWWDITKGPMAEVYGPELVDTVSGLLASTSPQNGPISNTQMASELIRRAIKGEPMVQPNWRAPATAMGDQNIGAGGFSPKPGAAFPGTNTWANNAQKVIEGRGSEILSDKVNDMRRALLGDMDVAVIDRHYAKRAEDPVRGIFTDVMPNKVSGAMETGKREAYPDIENQVRTAAKSAGVPLSQYSAWVWEGIRDTIRKTGGLYGQVHRSSAVPETTTGFNEIFTDLLQKKANHLKIPVPVLKERLRKGDAELLTALLSTGAGAAAYQSFKDAVAADAGAPPGPVGPGQ